MSKNDFFWLNRLLAAVKRGRR